MLIGVKVLSPSTPAAVEGVPCTRQRVYLAELEISTAKEALAEVLRGRQAVGNYNEAVFMRVGQDDNFFKLTSKAEIIGWINSRLKK